MQHRLLPAIVICASTLLLGCRIQTTVRHVERPVLEAPEAAEPDEPADREEEPEGPTAPAEPPPADPGPDGPKTQAWAPGAKALERLRETLRANFVRGMVAAGRLLRDAPGEQSLELGDRFTKAAQEGVPRAFRPWFMEWKQIRIFEQGQEVRLRFTFERWVKARAISKGSIKFHDANLYKSRARVVDGRLALETMRDPRFVGKPLPYADVRKTADTILLEPSESLPYPDCPFRGGTAPVVGLEDLRGISLQAIVDGLWETRYEILPVDRIFTGKDGDIWIAYLDVEDLEWEREVPEPTDDPAFGPKQAFPPYLERKPRESDVLGFFNMSANSRSVARD